MCLFFDGIWKELKNDAKELSRRDLAKQMFVSGALMCRESIERHMQEFSKSIKQNKDGIENEDNDLWEEGYFAETMSSKDKEEKMRTFHMKHDEEMNFNCKECNKKISAHNNDWHAGMCDGCFDKKYYNKNFE